MDSAKFQMDFLNSIAFNRFGGTDDEKRASEIIVKKIESLGGTAEVQEFPIPASEISKAYLEVTEPFHRVIEVTGIGRTGSTNGPIEGELFYAENGLEENFKGAEGKIVLVNRIWGGVYKRLMNSGAIAFLTYSGNFFDNRDLTDIERMMVSKNLTDKYGVIPGLCMRSEDAVSIMKDGATKVKIELEGTGPDLEHTSRNVTTFIEGTDPVKKKKEFVFTAHFDSTIYGHGAWDNGTGTCNIMELYRYLSEHRPEHSCRFVWCGSEEQGLFGSRAYVAAHKEEVEKMFLCLNFDMTGAIVGGHELLVTGNEEIQSYVKALSKEVGFITKLAQDIHASDSGPFAYAGVPAIGFMRYGVGTCHCRYDIPWFLSADRMKEATDFAELLIERIDKSKELPFKLDIIDPMKEKLTNFLYPKV